MTKRAFLRLGSLLLTTCSVALLLLSRPAAQRPAGVASVFDAYGQDGPAAGIAALRSYGDILAIRDRLTVEGPTWIAAAPAPQRDARRRIAALVALEAGYLGFADPAIQRPFNERENTSRTSVFLVRDVIELGCTWLRQGEPADFERLWMLASFALIQSTQNRHGYSADSLLALRSGPLGWPDALRKADAEHRAHVAVRFPRETRVALAAVLARPEVRRLPNRPGASAFFMTSGIGDTASGFEKEAGPLISDAIKQLSTLVDLPGIGLEARLRRGILLVQQKQLAPALVDIQLATASNDPTVTYLAHFYAGVTLDNLGRREEAIAELAAAQTVMPRARSGAFLLAADLFLADKRDEASALAAAALEHPSSFDPWRTFSLGDYRFWPDYLASLRAEVRR